MIRATVNDKTFEVVSSENGMELNGKAFEWDIESIGEGRFHIIKDDVSYLAEVIGSTEQGKQIQVKINNSVYDVSLKDKLDLLLEKLGIDNLNSDVANDIKAPMPGLILDIMVEAGTEVKKGDPVLILEAMKMENMIKAPADGVVSKIEAEKGESVEKGTVLVSF